MSARFRSVPWLALTLACGSAARADIQPPGPRRMNVSLVVQGSVPPGKFLGVGLTSQGIDTLYPGSVLSVSPHESRAPFAIVLFDERDRDAIQDAIRWDDVPRLRSLLHSRPLCAAPIPIGPLAPDGTSAEEIRYFYQVEIRAGACHATLIRCEIRTLSRLLSAEGYEAEPDPPPIASGVAAPAPAPSARAPAPADAAPPPGCGRCSYDDAAAAGLAPLGALLVLVVASGRRLRK
jgi:hypothetical protein